MMSFRTWLRSRLAPHPTPPARPARRLSVEPLEGRSVPAAAFGSAFSLPAATSEWTNQDIAVDIAGNTYVSGAFRGTADFDPAHVNPAAVLTSRGNEDGYVAKYGPTGAFQWVAPMGGAGYDVVKSVDVNPQTGDVYATGYFTGVADFGPFQRTTQGAESSSDGFVVRLDTNGAIRWAHQFGGAYEGDRGSGVAVDRATGVAYATGRLDLTAGNTNDNMDVYMARFDPAAAVDAAGRITPTWEKQVGGDRSDEGTAVAVDATGAVIFVGNFTGTADFDPDPGVVRSLRTGSTSSNTSAFALKLTAGGAYVWAVNFAIASTGSASRAADVATDSQNNVYLTGMFAGTVDFDPGKGKLNLPNAGQTDAYVAKLTPAGALAWAKSMGGSTNDYAYAMVVDARDNVYVTGSFGSTANFGGVSLASAGGSDVFVAKLSGGTGSVVWAYRMGGVGDDLGEGIAVDGLGNVYVTGVHTRKADFDPDPNREYCLDNSYAYGIFVVKLTQDTW